MFCEFRTKPWHIPHCWWCWWRPKVVKESCYLVNPAQTWQETDGDYCTLMVMSSAGDSSCKLFASWRNQEELSTLSAKHHRNEQIHISQSPSQPLWAIPQLQVQHEAWLVGSLQAQLAHAPLQPLAALRCQVLLAHAPLETLAALRCQVLLAHAPLQPRTPPLLWDPGVWWQAGILLDQFFRP